jgi:amino acid adenylation domain-containing protein
MHKGVDLSLTLEHDPAVFGPLEVAFIAEQMAELLKSAVDQPMGAIRDLNMLGEFERGKLTVEWNHRPAGRVSGPLVHEMFDRQVKRKPNAVAVMCGNEQLSYVELDERARLLAVYLRQLGVGRESRVAICMRRTVSLAVAVLGVLKSGAAYLPLDPSFPQKRLNFMIEDASAEILLTEESAQLAFEADGAKVICLDTDWLKIVGVNDPQSINANIIAPENSAYLIYTSGSTGNPKAVLIEHRQLANYVHSVVERFELESVRGMGNVSTLATDLGNTAIFSSLCSGGCLHLVPQALVNDADLFWAYVERHKIEALKIVPSHLASLLEGVAEQRRMPLNLLVLGGEAADRELIDRVRKLNPRCRVFNHYGPTETTIGALTYNVREAEPSDESTTIPLGRPLRNVTAYVLDERMQLVNVGMAGELYIGGAAVGRGYFRRVDLTAERFVPNPFDLAGGGSRLYRTGDMARFRADGNIEFLGRLDNQVKIRGHRVELGEIEAALRQYPTVRTAVVRKGADPSGSLIGYVVLENKSDEQDLGPALRHFLEDRLPQHMIPSAFVILDRLPLTASGKIDFNSLPPPVSDTHYVMPRSRVEEIMADLWQHVLGVERVGVFDNFFDRGGHSISATRLVTRVRQAFQVDIEVASVFESPTIASFVVALAQRLVEQSSADQVTDLIDELEAADAPSARLQRL